MKVKHGRHVIIECRFKKGQKVKLDTVFGMGKVNGKRQFLGGRIFIIMEIERCNICESGFMVRVAKDLLLDSNWFTAV